RGNGFVQNEALAHELAAKFYLGRGLETPADAHLREARNCYRRWGADGKVRQLEGLYPGLAESASASLTGTVAGHMEALDLVSVCKAAQTISGEMVEEKLVPTLLRVALEQSGASKACLIGVRDGGLHVDAEARLEGGRVAANILPRAPLDPS